MALEKFYRKTLIVGPWKIIPNKYYAVVQGLRDCHAPSDAEGRINKDQVHTFNFLKPSPTLILGNFSFNCDTSASKKHN